MLTIFATPRPFVGKFALIQRNAVSSWKALPGQPEVVLLGSDPDTAELAAGLGLRHVPDVECNEFGTPLVSSLLATAERLASHDVLAYVNADIVLLDDFVEAVERVHKRPFLMVGRSWGVSVENLLDFSSVAWKEAMADAVRRGGNRRQGMDYFVFSRGLWAAVPPFAVGRGVWDEWLIYAALSRGCPVVDASEAALVVHQNHDWSAHPGGKEWIWDGPEIKRNRELAGPYAMTYSIKDATWRLTSRGLVSVISRRRVGRLAERMEREHPALRPLARMLAYAAQPGRLLRR